MVFGFGPGLLLWPIAGLKYDRHHIQKNLASELHIQYQLVNFDRHTESSASTHTALLQPP